MIIKLNPTGTHVHKGLLKVLLDLYPEPTDKSYPFYYVDIQNRKPTKQELTNPAKFALIPIHKVLNPCLSVFITVPELLTRTILSDFIISRLNRDVITTIDNIMTLPDSVHYISPFMRNKTYLTREVITTGDILDLVGTVNSKLSDLALRASTDGDVISINPETIDMGPGATDRATATEIAAGGETGIDTHNPANANGTIDTFEIFLVSWGGNAANSKMGTFSGSGTSWTSRDFEALGTITAGSKQTYSGLNNDVQTNDIIAMYGDTAGYLELDTSGYTSYGVYAGDAFTGSPITFTMNNTWAVSLYGTGVESGGAYVPRIIVI